MITSEQITNFFEVTNDAQNILILNSKPDGDSIGASLALNKILNKQEKKVQSYTCSPVPEYLRLLTDKGKITFEIEPDKDQFKNIDLIIIVDGADLKRTLGVKEFNWDSNVKILAIDHHQVNNNQTGTLANSHIVNDPIAESTCGMIIDIFESYKLESGNDLLDPEIAFLLYAGIVSDTDYFGYANVSTETFERASVLMRYQFDVIPIIKQFRESLGSRAFKFIQKNIGKVVLNEEKRYAYMKIMRSDCGEEDNLAVVNEAANFLNRAIIRIVDTVDFSFIIREVNDTRSSVAFRRHNNGNTIDLSKIAAKFNGGGHTQAAGAVLDKKADQLEKELISYLDSSLV
jgi:bifunctional oligoribonuclease and PAP phosphatase NrnA